VKIVCAFGKHNYGRAERGVGYEYANFLPALTSLGHEVVFFELWDRSAYTDFADLNRQFLRCIELEKPDVVLCVTMSTELWIETLQMARRGSRAVFVHWDTDDSWKYEQCSRLLAPAFDAMATTDPSALHKAAGDGLVNFVPTQWAASTASMGEPLPAAQCSHGVSFIGSAYGNRKSWIEGLRQQGIAVECFGHGWPNGPVAAEDIPRIMRSSVVSLNFGDSGVVMQGAVPARSRQIKARVFEVPGAGGLLMTEQAEHLDDYFHPGEEIVEFDSLDALVEGIRTLLAEPGRRDAIARAGHARCRREHSYEARFTDLLQAALALHGARPAAQGEIDFAAFEAVAADHRTGCLLRLLRGLLILPCRLIWGRVRGARAARRLVFELSWRVFGEKTYRAGGWPGRLFYHES